MASNPGFERYLEWEESGIFSLTLFLRHRGSYKGLCLSLIFVSEGLFFGAYGECKDWFFWVTDVKLRKGVLVCEGSKLK